MKRAGAALAALALAAAGIAAAQDSGTDAESEPAVSAEPVTLQALADYMSGLEQGLAQFSQLNTDGSISTGSILVKRPTYARIEYDPPASGLIIADSFRVAVFDLKSNTDPVVVPLGSTPLYYLLQDAIRIDDPSVLMNYKIGAASSEVAMRGPSKSNSGFIRLIFQHRPIRLAGWTYFDEFGQPTRMTFGNLVPNIQIDPDMFDIDGEIRRRSK